MKKIFSLQSVLFLLICTFALSSCKGLFNSGNVSELYLQENSNTYVGFTASSSSRNVVPWISNGDGTLRYELEIYDKDGNFLKNVTKPYEFDKEKLTQAIGKMYKERLSASVKQNEVVNEGEVVQTEEAVAQGEGKKNTEETVESEEQMIDLIVDELISKLDLGSEYITNLSMLYVDLEPGSYSFVINAYGNEELNKDILIMTGKSNVVEIKAAACDPTDLFLEYLIGEGAEENTESSNLDLNIINIPLKLVSNDTNKGFVEYTLYCSNFNKDDISYEFRYTTRSDFLANGNNASWKSSANEKNFEISLLNPREYFLKTNTFIDKEVIEEQLEYYSDDYENFYLTCSISDLKSDKYYVQCVVKQTLKGKEYPLYSGNVFDVLSGYKSSTCDELYGNPDYKDVTFFMQLEENETVTWRAPGSSYSYYGNETKVSLIQNKYYDVIEPEREGYTFTGWQRLNADDELEDFNWYFTYNNVEDGDKFYATWKLSGNTEIEPIEETIYKNITFNFQLDSDELIIWKEPGDLEERSYESIFTMVKEENFNGIMGIPVRENYEFAGWGKMVDGEIVETSDIIWTNGTDTFTSYSDILKEIGANATLAMEKFEDNETLYAIWNKVIYFNFIETYPQPENNEILWKYIGETQESNYTEEYKYLCKPGTSFELYPPTRTGWVAYRWTEYKNNGYVHTSQFEYSEYPIAPVTITYDSITAGTKFGISWYKTLKFDLNFNEGETINWASPLDTNEKDYSSSDNNVKVEISYEPNEKIRFSKPTKPGYTCVGWATTSDGTEPLDYITYNEARSKYEINSSDIDSSATYYAIWAKLITFNLNYEDEDATVTWQAPGKDEEEAYTSEYTYTIMPGTNFVLNLPTKDRYAFSKWLEYDEGNEIYIDPTQFLNPETPGPITISYDNIKDGTKIAAKWNGIINFDLNFIGDETINWASPESTGTYKKNYTSSSVEDFTYYFDPADVVNSFYFSTPTKEGYTCIGWGYTSNATQIVPAISPVNGGKDGYALQHSNALPGITYYAIWKKTVTFDFQLNEGETVSWQPPEDQGNTVNCSIYTYVVKATVNDAVWLFHPTREGYTFVEWLEWDASRNSYISSDLLNSLEDGGIWSVLNDTVAPGAKYSARWEPQ